MTAQIGRILINRFRTYCARTSFKRCAHSQESPVIIKDENGVRNIIMNNPKTRNSLSLPMMAAIMDGMKDLKDPSLRCVVISSTGTVFSSGHNLKDLATGEEELYLETFSKCGELMLAILEAPVPVIATVNGVAAAAGCQLVATCDIVIATERSTFSTPGANFGIFCSTPGIALVRTVGKKAAARMLLTGEPISAAEALRVGLISVMCKEDELGAELEKHVQAIKNKSRSVIELGKRFFYQQLETDVRSAYKYLLSFSEFYAAYHFEYNIPSWRNVWIVIFKVIHAVKVGKYDLGTRVMTDNLLLADGQEGIKSFAEKRTPMWKNDFTKY